MNSHRGRRMHGVRHLGWFAVVTCLFLALSAANAGPRYVPAPAPSEKTIVEVRVGLGDMTGEQRKNLWRMVDEYASVEALKEFCGKTANIHRRAWNAVRECVDLKSLRSVLSKFNSKKSEYLKAWKDLYTDEERKTELCKQYGSELVRLTGIMNKQVAEAASMCRSCLFC